MKTSATAKFIGTSSRKIGLVAALIRGRSVVDAQRVLASTDKRATDPIGKVLKSALANAENNLSLKKADLVVNSVLVGPGPTLKRFRTRAKGAASSIRKRSSHITIVLDDKAVTPDSKPKTSTNKATSPAPLAQKASQKPSKALDKIKKEAS